MAMSSPSVPKPVSQQGAAADAILHGAGPNNRGLRLRTIEAQHRGSDGPIRGPFVLLDVGSNRHSDALSPLLNKVTDAQEVLAVIRRRHPACVSVVNANLLVAEDERPPGRGEGTAPGPAS